MIGGSIDTTEVKSLAARLSRIPKEFQAGVRKPLRAVGTALLADARANSTWSSRIPGSLSLRVTLNGRRPGVTVRASLKSAPEARVYEGILDDTFKHPLFGDRDNWYPQAARPYLLPAVEANTQRVVDEITRLVEDVERRAGLG